MRLCDHAEVGRQLGEYVARLAPADPVVVALPYGGVRIGAEIARRLEAPMDILMAAEVCIPGPCNTPIGCVAGGRFYPDPAALVRRGIGHQYAEILAAAELKSQGCMARVLRRGERPIDLTGRTAILVSDGSPPPAILRAAVTALRDRHAAEVLYAAPAVVQGLHDLVSKPGQLITLFRPEELGSVMLVNAGNRQTTEDEIAGLLRESRRSQRRQPALA